MFPPSAQLRMLYSQGVRLEDLGVAPLAGGAVASDREAWRTLCAHAHLLRGTPSGSWLREVLAGVFEWRDWPLTAASADASFDHIGDRLSRPEWRPRALFNRFNLQVSEGRAMGRGAKGLGGNRARWRDCRMWMRQVYALHTWTQRSGPHIKCVLCRGPVRHARPRHRTVLRVWSDGEMERWREGVIERRSDREME